MRVWPVSHHEVRQVELPLQNWNLFLEDVAALLDLFAPLCGQNSDRISLIRGDDDGLAFKVGESQVSLARSADYRPQKTLHVSALCDLFVRSVYLALAFHSPDRANLKLQSSGCLDGWLASQKVYAEAIGHNINVLDLTAQGRLDQGAGKPIRPEGDSNVIFVADEILIALNRAAEDLAAVPVASISVPSQSWFF